jgi:hypothetical protein
VTRKDRIRRALAELEAERRAGQQERDKRAGAYLERHRAGRGGRAPREARVAAARAKLDRETARYEAKTAARQARLEAARRSGRRGLPGTPPVPASEYCRVKAAAARLAAAEAAQAAQPDGEERKRNVTDPDSRLMPVRGGGFIQGYNAQAVHSTDGLCPGTLLTQDTTDYASFAPMTGKAEAASGLLRARARGPVRRLRAKIGTMLADAGYCSEANLSLPGPGRLIATSKRRDLEHAAARAAPGPAAGGRGGDLAAAMAARLASSAGRAAYRKRGPLAEGPFGNIKHNRGFRQFSRRGLARASGEWSFQNSAANLLTIHSTRWRPSPA